MQKNRHRISYHCRASKGNVNYLLSKFAKIQGLHKPSKKYEIDTTKFKKDDEANKEQEQINTE